MSVALQPTQHPGSAGDVPDVVNKVVTGSETWDKGTILTRNNSDEFSEIGTDITTASHYAVSLEGAENGSPDGPADEVAAARVDEDTYFLCQVWDGSASEVRSDIGSGSPTLTPGDQYGYTVQTVNGQDVYMLDDSDTTNLVFEIVDVLEDHDLVVVAFLESVIDKP